MTNFYFFSITRPQNVARLLQVPGPVTSTNKVLISGEDVAHYDKIVNQVGNYL